MASRHWLYFGGFVVTGILLVGAGLMGIRDGLSVLFDGGAAAYGEELLLVAMLGAAAEWVVIVLVLGLIATVFLVATVVSVLRSASLPRDDRLVSLVEWFERRYPILRRFDVGKRVAPTTEERRRQLEERYVTGEIDEATFEREMERLLDDTPSDGDGDGRFRSGDDVSVETHDRS